MQFRFSNVHIEGFGIHLPDDIVTSLEIEGRLAPLYQRLGLVPGRLELMTGIRERRFWKPGTLPSQVAAEAGRRVLAESAIDPSLVGALFNTSVSRDCVEPATANMVHAALGLPSISMVLDISNACLGFLNGMMLAGQLIESGVIKAAVITAGENGGPLVKSTIDYANSSPDITRHTFKKMFASLTIGSGAVAALLTHSSISRTSHRLTGGVVMNNTSFSNLCRGGDSGVGERSSNGLVLMETASEELMERGVELAADTWQEFTGSFGVAESNIHHFFSHQVGAVHRRRMYDAIGADMAKDYSTVEFLGNVGSVSLPVTMAMGIQQKPVEAGEQIGLLGIGSGINCMMMTVAW
ncbi:MAG: 3-oxoacyl-ACP synthase III [Candidatus Wallbacteria bacterium HGW-Wallbacteria-1]|jgi:3-oxoacyl-[acyl-carrier-protein] synthase-3|uniref:3-oxoacyl-ACP synthase III n=1 Tax=Candidatus Wallbacteria bacterium HGW-Wallbacteria-1 TaxID=2013854 RepID=A0A2N1PUA4_9BACT|nr:MAG: 3-oxoacyl-ACP synthase III [Candidatus Wallbacteria bacterium HGW-Wallbacteria-1]